MMTATALADLAEQVTAVREQWDTTSEVDTDLGVETQDIGGAVSISAHAVLPADTADLARLDEAVAAYADLDEHDTVFALDILESTERVLDLLLSA